MRAAKPGQDFLRLTRLYRIERKEAYVALMFEGMKGASWFERAEQTAVRRWCAVRCMEQSIESFCP